MSETTKRVSEADPGRAWLEVREGALGWIAAERPDWWHGENTPKGRRTNAARIVADTGLPRMTIYRFRELEGVEGPAALEADNIARLVSLGALERRVDEPTAFSKLFKVVCPAAAEPVAA